MGNTGDSHRPFADYRLGNKPVATRATSLTDLSAHYFSASTGSGLLRFRFGFRCVVSDGGISGTAAGPPTSG
ncbi:hypothetical protein AB0P23_24970, partial [Rhodococcus sp. NPDC077669]|uniref:hypothetical protein n=1 Tax=Rhodococcus sp. NPDC077669 TaxID=3155174 RepID=UPI0034480942